MGNLGGLSINKIQVEALRIHLLKTIIVVNCFLSSFNKNKIYLFKDDYCYYSCGYVDLRFI